MTGGGEMSWLAIAIIDNHSTVHILYKEAALTTSANDVSPSAPEIHHDCSQKQ
jgi:hypothetical protein